MLSRGQAIATTARPTIRARFPVPPIQQSTQIYSGTGAPSDTGNTPINQVYFDSSTGAIYTRPSSGSSWTPLP